MGEARAQRFFSPGEVQHLVRPQIHFMFFFRPQFPQVRNKGLGSASSSCTSPDMVSSALRGFACSRGLAGDDGKWPVVGVRAQNGGADSKHSFPRVPFLLKVPKAPAPATGPRPTPVLGREYSWTDRFCHSRGPGRKGKPPLLTALRAWCDQPAHKPRS